MALAQLAAVLESVLVEPQLQAEQRLEVQPAEKLGAVAGLVLVLEVSALRLVALQETARFVQSHPVLIP